jgi:hypothetical protein
MWCLLLLQVQRIDHDDAGDAASAGVTVATRSASGCGAGTGCLGPGEPNLLSSLPVVDSDPWTQSLAAFQQELDVDFTRDSKYDMDLFTGLDESDMACIASALALDLGDDSALREPSGFPLPVALL